MLWYFQKCRIFWKYHISDFNIFLSPTPSNFHTVAFCLKVTKQLVLYFWISVFQRERKRGELVFHTLYYFAQNWVSCSFPYQSWVKENALIRTDLDQVWSFSEPCSLSSRDIFQHLKNPGLEKGDGKTTVGVYY